MHLAERDGYFLCSRYGMQSVPATLRHMRLLIKNANVVLPDGIAPVSVVVEDGRIADIDAAAQLAVDEVVDATGLHLLPGIIDDQVHFREPGLTHKEDLA